jgi:hypothetical protein
MQLINALSTLALPVLAVATVISVVWGVWTYRRNTEAQVQVLALGALQHYLDLAVAHPDLASPDNEQPIDPRYGWFAAQALVTAQTLWTLVGRRADWQRAINAIVRRHRAYLRSGAFVCEDFAPDFVSYLRERVSDLKCAEVSDAK